jgi:hypothetical protein
MILQASVPLYERLIAHLSRGYHQLYLLARGLKTLPAVASSFDSAWFKTWIMEPYRKVLMKFPIVETEDSSNHFLFDKQGKPFCQFIIDDDEAGTLYDLYGDVFGLSRLPQKCQNGEWVKYAWSECGVRGVKFLCEYIAGRGQTSNLAMQDTATMDVYQWLDTMFAFMIRTGNRVLLETEKVIPNMNDEFVCWDRVGLFDGKTLTEVMIDCLKDLNENVRPILMHNRISSIPARKMGALDVAERIDKRVMKIQQTKKSFEAITRDIWPILRITPDDISPKVAKMQQSIQYFTHSLCSDLSEAITVRQFPANAWKSANKWILKNLIIQLASFQRVDSIVLYEAIDKFDWLNRFFEFIQENVYFEDLDSSSYPVIPDRSGRFQRISELADDQVPEAFKDGCFASIGLDFTSKLIHPKIKTVKLQQRYDIMHIMTCITQMFEKIRRDLAYGQNRWTQKAQELDQKQVKAALHLVHVLPPQNSEIHEKHRELLAITRMVLPSETAKMNESIVPGIEDIWRDSIIIVIKAILAKVESFDSLARLPYNWNRLEFVHKLHRMLSNFAPDTIRTVRIYPNQLGQFKTLSGLRIAPDVPEELMNALRELSSRANRQGGLTEDLRERLVDPALSIDGKWARIELSEVCGKVDQRIDVLFQEAKNHSDATLRKYAVYVDTTWFQDETDGSGPRLFPRFHRNRGLIVCQIIFDNDTRNLLTALRLLSKPELREFCQDIRTRAHLREDIARLKEQETGLQQEVQLMENGCQKQKS